MCGDKFRTGQLKLISGETDGFVSDAPQFFGRKPQPSSEGRKDNGEYSGHGFTVVVEKFNAGLQGQQQRTREGSAAFWILLGAAMVAGIGSYWMASHQR